MRDIFSQYIFQNNRWRHRFTPQQQHSNSKQTSGGLYDLILIGVNVLFVYVAYATCLAWLHRTQYTSSFHHLTRCLKMPQAIHVIDQQRPRYISAFQIQQLTLPVSCVVMVIPSLTRAVPATLHTDGCSLMVPFTHGCSGVGMQGNAIIPLI